MIALRPNKVSSLHVFSYPVDINLSSLRIVRACSKECFVVARANNSDQQHKQNDHEEVPYVSRWLPSYLQRVPAQEQWVFIWAVLAMLAAFGAGSFFLFVLLSK